MIQILHGEETYCIDKKIDKAKAKITELPDVNITVFDDKYTVAEVINAVSASPLLSEKRLVVLRLQSMKSADDVKRIADSVPESTDFVLAVPALDKRTAFYKAYKECVLPCEKCDEETVIKFIGQKSSENGIRATRDGAMELVRRTAYLEQKGVSLYAVETAIKQLALLKKDITVEDVAVIPETSSGNKYELARLLCMGNTEELFNQAHHLLENGENEIGLLALLARVFRLAWTDKVHGRRSCGAPYYQYEVAADYSKEVLGAVQGVFNDAIRQIKSGHTSRLVFELALSRAILILSK